MNATAASRATGFADAIAGLSIAGLLLPEAVAYSSIAGLPAQAGLIALFAGLVCYGLLGTSRFAIISATSSSAAVLAAVVAGFGDIDPSLRLTLAAGLVIVTGAFFVIAGWARLGNVTDFIARPVLRGFAFGLALLIILKQVMAMAGAHAASNNLFGLLQALAATRSHWNTTGLALGAAALLLLFVLGRVRAVPAALIALVLGVLATRWLGLAQHGVALVGTIDWQPAAPALPALGRAQWLRLGEVGFALLMILYSESYGSIRNFAMKHGDRIAPNRDLLVLGLANLLSGLLRGMPVGAGYSATAANEAAGAVSRRAGLFSAAFVLVIVYLLLHLLALAPEPVLAAVVIHAVSHTLNPAAFRSYFVWHRDRLVVIAAVIAVLWLGVLDGLLAAIGVSLLIMLRDLSLPRVSVLGRLGAGHDFVSLSAHPEALAPAGLLIVRPEQPLFFANVERMLGEVRRMLDAAGNEVHTLILSLEESPDLDSTCLEALRDLFDYCGAHHTRLLLARLKGPVQALLAQICPQGTDAPVLTGLSVDDAVRTAGQLERGDG
ncbi:MAG TPA: SulP family inorganic anion transporter [Steroidobacteraceae bacterium]|nr:SulP family inorganic anion transporter [Steroidobacteraceae bacterium]